MHAMVQDMSGLSGLHSHVVEEDTFFCFVFFFAVFFAFFLFVGEKALQISLVGQKMQSRVGAGQGSGSVVS